MGRHSPEIVDRSKAERHTLVPQLVKLGFKEIEVSFPASSRTDFDFTRQLIERRLVPDDVTIQVLTQSRPELIERTMASIRGARRAIVHQQPALSLIGVWRAQRATRPVEIA